MLLTFLGHAGFLIEYKNTLLILDPWLSKRGAYDSAWLQFPCNHHLESLILEKCASYQYVYTYLSHEHKDHFDTEFLKKALTVKNDINFVVPNFKSKSFLLDLKNLNPHHIIELDNDEHIKIKELDIYLFMDESGINHDSGILIKGGHHSFLNLNDCKIFDRCQYLKTKYGAPDVFSVQFSGASWHPICYALPEETYQKISKQKKLSKYRTVLNALKTLTPKRYLPAAGPPALLDPMHHAINFQKDSIFPQQFDIIQFLATFKLPTLLDSIMPGDVYSFETDSYLTLAQNRLTAENYQSMIEQYIQQTSYLFAENYQSFPSNLESLFQDYFQILAAKTQLFSIQETIPHRLYFGINEVLNKFIEVDLNNQTCRIVTEKPTINFYFITYPAWQINRFKQGFIKGEDLALTFRGHMERSPDIYSTWISCFINSEVEQLKENIKLITDIRNNQEKIVIKCNDKHYQIKRYCPHQGADLTYGWAQGNHWVCPKHRWQYNLDNHGLCESANACIDAVLIDIDESALVT